MLLTAGPLQLIFFFPAARAPPVPPLSILNVMKMAFERRTVSWALWFAQALLHYLAFKPLYVPWREPCRHAYSLSGSGARCVVTAVHPQYPSR